MSDKPSEESLTEIQLEDMKIVDEDSDTSNSNNHVDLASAATNEISEFEQIITGMSRNTRLASLSFDTVNHLHQDLKAKLHLMLRDDDEAKQAGGNGGNGDAESKKIDIDEAEPPSPLLKPEEILPEEGEEN